MNEETTFVEASTGNQGIAVAMACAARGHRCIICIPELAGLERIKLMQIYGAEVILTPTYEDMEKTVWTACEMAAELERDRPNTVYLRQFENTANPQAHKLTTAAQIIRDVGANFDAFVATIGTGGTLSGCAGMLKEVLPQVIIVGAEPAAAAWEGEGKKGLHMQEGIGDAQVADFMPRELIDDFVACMPGAARLADHSHRIDTTKHRVVGHKVGGPQWGMWSTLQGFAPQRRKQ